MVYDAGPAFKVSHVHCNWCQSAISWYYKLLSFSTQKIEKQRRKVLATLIQVHNEEHRHRVKIQNQTQNKEQMLRRSSQVTFIKKIDMKYCFIWENVVEWVNRRSASKSDVTASLIHFYSAFHWPAKLMLSKKGFLSVKVV